MRKTGTFGSGLDTKSPIGLLVIWCLVYSLVFQYTTNNSVEFLIFLPFDASHMPLFPYLTPLLDFPWTDYKEVTQQFQHLKVALVNINTVC